MCSNSVAKVYMYKVSMDKLSQVRTNEVSHAIIHTVKPLSLFPAKYTLGCVTVLIS